MRRSTPLGLIAAAALLLVLCGAYTFFWFVAAGRINAGVAEWAESQRAQKIEISWRTIRVGGFPFDFRVDLEGAEVKDRAMAANAEIAVPVLSASARPWNFRAWRLVAPDGLSAAFGAAAEPFARLKAQAAFGSVAVGEQGTSIWLGLSRLTAEAGLRLGAHTADLWVTLPPHEPRTHTEPAFGLAVDLHEVSLPLVPAAFPNLLDEVALGATVMGAVPAGPAQQAASAWRDSGGTLELDHLDLRWGALAITGSGTLALDADLQPIGGFSGAIEGYEQLMSALVAAGRVRQSNAGLARLALAMLTKAGPDGRPQISTSFTIQNGEMFLGPMKLGPAPRIPW